jgi:hypothetical protein
MIGKYSGQPENTAINTQREAPIPLLLNRLDKLLVHAEGTVQELDARLSPILCPRPTVAQEAGMRSAPDFGSGLAMTLTLYEQRLQATVDNLQSILRSLEI